MSVEEAIQQHVESVLQRAPNTHSRDAFDHGYSWWEDSVLVPWFQRAGEHLGLDSEHHHLRRHMDPSSIHVSLDVRDQTKGTVGVTLPPRDHPSPKLSFSDPRISSDATREERTLVSMLDRIMREWLPPFHTASVARMRTL